MAENGPIERVANIVSSKLFSKFKWKQVGPLNQDFPCRKEDEHKPKTKTQSHTHPVDIVFAYKDPYLNRVVYLNTDLKSYSKTSINSSKVEGALKSLAHTIDCASNSPQWKTKYDIIHGPSEVRGMLFVYNHDNLSTKDFYEFFYPTKKDGAKRKPASVKLDRVELPKNKQIHLVEPSLITYMMTVVSDMNEMTAEKVFPNDGYGFYYPELTLHKVLVSDEFLPATIELISAPFMILKHDKVIEYTAGGEVNELYPEGFVVYYNRRGEEDLEFLYLLDTLSKYQVLNRRNKIRIRVASEKRSASIRSNYERALEKYAFDWGYDESAVEYLKSIEFDIVPTTKEFYCTEEISWEI
ncbi:hypothetical protein [Alteromonas macleodii]|uniref:GAPS4 PD-(D/E)XK nuclease domain-containing protein n=1 Tax=Alteromonas macleodii TaxID=28108 RepID=A0A6T9Y267_ALTMA|nr:hypothetical protein [Alteromonas macleodii]CAB9495177.1 conserved protein of unknown function [Alteromonas macleodii]